MLIMFTFKWENFSFVFLFGFVLFFITEIRKITRCLHFGWFTFVVHVLLNCIFDLFIHNGKMCFFFFCQNRIGETCKILFFFVVLCEWMNEWMKAYIIHIIYVSTWRETENFWAIFTVTEILCLFFPFRWEIDWNEKLKLETGFVFLYFAFKILSVWV